MKKLLIVFIALIFSCSENVTYLKLLSSDPGVIPLANEFNKKNTKIQIIIENNPVPGSRWDIIIYNNELDNRLYTTLNLESFIRNQLNKDLFYPDLLFSCKTNDMERNRLPLAFDISGVIYSRLNTHKTAVTDIEDFIAEKNIKFSPYWNTNFLLWQYLTLYPRIEEDNNYFDINIFKVILEQNQEIIKNSPLFDNSDYYTKYKHLSHWNLVKNRKIDYFFMNFSEYIKSDYKQKKDIGFSIFSSKELIPVAEDVTYISINKNTKFKKESLFFLNWIFQIESQQNIIEASLKNTSNPPLFLGLFSSLHQINSQILPVYYSDLENFFPKKEEITFISNLPQKWKTLKYQVYTPLFHESSNGEAKDWETIQLDLFTNWQKKNLK